MSTVTLHPITSTDFSKNTSFTTEDLNTTPHLSLICTALSYRDKSSPSTTRSHAAEEQSRKDKGEDQRRWITPAVKARAVQRVWW